MPRILLVLEESKSEYFGLEHNVLYSILFIGLKIVFELTKFIDELISYLLGIEKKYFIKGIKFLIRKKIKDIIFTIKFNNQIRKFTRLVKFNYKKTKDL